MATCIYKALKSEKTTINEGQELVEGGGGTDDSADADALVPGGSRQDRLRCERGAGKDWSPSAAHRQRFGDLGCKVFESGGRSTGSVGTAILMEAAAVVAGRL
ncbi:hypothetical protein NDU88_003937 [Pleurodeles waltl]|uniref:Uncharacterized protein n=1 Tax=Pleurodeles waltl TaxID=8319 RepID=A0AAV7UE16_PLEWA|nr:hypothetical protein NDU88_003937 [Pleurodeles waltl]